MSGLVITLTGFAAPVKLPLSKTIHHHESFISHIGSPVGYWLGENVNFTPVDQLREKAQKQLKTPTLLTRGDAHITVITPPEYQNVLSPYLSAEQIDQIAMTAHIQKREFKVVCLGHGVAKESSGDLLQNYFIVVKSPGLLKIRQKIFKAYVHNGGPASRFDPWHFTPHITVGFTKRDLFESDGVFKQLNACVASLKS